MALASISNNSDIWKNWEKSGKNDFIKIIKNSLKNHDDSHFFKIDVYKNGLGKAIYYLTWKCLNGKIKKESVLNTFHEICNFHWDLPAIILDIINVIDAETSVMDELKDERKIFCQLTKNLDLLLSEKLLKERLEIDTLQDAGTVKPKAFYTKFIKIKTKLYYKQRRFNLFREETEGYAKLITELNQDFDHNEDVSNIMNIIKSLIGCFNLDPNRVLDIILESFETKPDRYSTFIPLLKSYMPDGTIICEVLGYKFKTFHDSNTPVSLYQITALLLKHSVIKLDDIYLWLNPNDKLIADAWEKELSEAKEYVRKMNIILTNKDKEPEKEPEKDENIVEKYSKNQKYGLCEALLSVGDWSNAQILIKKLPDRCVIVHEPIAKQLAKLIHISIDYLYTKKCFTALLNKKNKFTDDNEVVKQLQALNFPDLITHAFPMIIAMGPSLHYDPVLIYKLIRVLKTFLNEMNVDSLNMPTPKTANETLYFGSLTILDSAILPALSYLDCNCCIAEELWTVVKFFPYHIRYSLYSKWKNETFNLEPQLIRRSGVTQKNVKALMKRVSKENVKPVGRLFGKLSHCSPGLLFDYILLQIQIYDNLIGPVVDSLKYLTSLSYDVLGYCMIEALAIAERDRFKDDGTSLSMWLQSLANFAGAVYKKYNIELSGMLQYVGNQLKSQRSLDLLILKEIVQKMTGIEASEEMTTEQLSAMSGGELLRGEAGYFSQVRNTKKSSQRLKDALASNDLTVTLCLLMAQQKHCVIYRETAQNHLKLVGKLYDQCQDTLVQFGTFLGSTYSVDEYVERLPSIITMLQEYHINADVAFFLARPMFTHLITQKYDSLRKSDPNSKKMTTVQKMTKYLEATQAVMNPIVESVKPLHGPKVWEDISPQFLVTFWSLGLYDLQVPSDSYLKEINKLKLLSLSALDSKDTNISKGKKEQERYIALMEKLQDEKKKHQEHVDKIYQRLNQEKDNWFLSRSAKSAKNETITQFLQLCLFPRCTFTALDAIYCAKFVHCIHNLKASNFSTLLCYDRIFCDITYSVTSCTENEATRYGRFLCAMLETVMKWHSNQDIFNKECASYPGFVTKFRVSNQFSEANDHVGYENYRHVCHKWHYKITKSIVFCLDSKDYMQIRNALIILMRILQHFPVLTKLALIIEKKVEKVREEEKNQRPDLFVLASCYIGQLKSKSIHMIKESDFHQVFEKPQKEVFETTKSSTNGITKNETRRDKDKIDKKLSKPINIDDKNYIYEVKSESNEYDKIKDLKKEEKDDDVRKKDKKRENKTDVPSILMDSQQLHNHEYNEYEKEREPDRDLSSVSNSSNGSLHRRNQDIIADFEKDSKRRKIESSNHKKSEELFETKKDRTGKSKERKEKIIDDEKDSRRESRKIGRKRERLEESSGTDHKRRREANSNVDDELTVREKYYTREKSPHRDGKEKQSHDKFEKEKSYSLTKSTRSRIGY